MAVSKLIYSICGPRMPPKQSTTAGSSGSQPRKRRAPVQPLIRSRLSLNKSTMSPGEWGEPITNLTRVQQDRFNNLVHRPFAPCKCFHAPTLDQLRIAREVEQLFSAIGWQKYLIIDYPTFEELCCEFYSTFEFTRNEFITLDEPEIIQFRLRGTQFSMSINEFNLILGFVSEDTIATGAYINSACDYTRPFSTDYIDIWREWSTNR